MPAANAPEWGKLNYGSPEAVLGYFEAPEIYNDADDPADGGTVVAASAVEAALPLRVFPNPATEQVQVQPADGLQELLLLNMYGRTLRRVQGAAELSLRGLPAGWYGLQAHYRDGVLRRVVVLKN